MMGLSSYNDTPPLTSEDYISNLQIRNHTLTDREFLYRVAPDLQSVHLQNCPNLGDKALYGLARAPSLSDLSWISNPGATDDGYYSFVQKCTRLASFNISGCAVFSTRTCQYLLSRSTELKALDISFCPVEDGAFSELSAPIAYLNLQGCTKITDATLRLLARAPTLKYLSLGYNDGITEEGLGIVKAASVTILRK
jgi:hypothetical protein